MLARRMKFQIEDLEIGSTPMLIPSLSSRANIDINQSLEVIREIVKGPLLLSLYDVFYASPNLKEISFPDLIFLDSGGYECAKDCVVTEYGFYRPDPQIWNYNFYLAAMEKWKQIQKDQEQIPTIIVSYDHPLEKMPIQVQITKAKETFDTQENVLKEILIKPENSDNLNIDLIIENLKYLTEFYLIGFTEKDLGNSISERMKNIIKIRIAMEKIGQKLPIHIFGSLDPVTTPLYYFSGADVFDGLSWLNFIFYNGEMMYRDSLGPKMFGINEDIDGIWIKTLVNNYDYLTKMKIDLERFHSSRDFNIFKNNADFFKTTIETINGEIGGII